LNYEQAQNEIVKIMELMARKHSLHNVFRDFTTLAACTISNSVDKTQFKEREERYMRTISKYNKEEANKFAKILALVTTGLSGARYGDFLGELFMKLEISNKNSGQFFTPYDISKMMAQLLDVDKTDDVLKLSEPAVGSGGMVIAYAETMQSKGLNYQKQLEVICNDIDFDVVRMCYIQLSLLGIDAVVMQADTLTMEVGEYWYTPMHIINKIEKEQKSKTNKMVESMNKLIKNNEVKQPVKENDGLPGQMDIFDFV